MGCAGTREHSEEEEHLKADEQALGYWKISASTIDAVLRKFSAYGRLNQNQFKDAIEILKVPVEQVTELGSLSAFYEKFRTEDSYKLNRLLVLGVLLGRGNGKLKAQLWFEIYDKLGSQTLTQVEAKKMLRQTFAVAVDYLGELNTTRVDRTLELNYFGHLRSVKDWVCDEVVRRLFKGDQSLTRDQFVTRLSNESEFKALLTASGFRRFAFIQYKARPSSAYVNDLLRLQQ
jgi:hypothetical protein